MTYAMLLQILEESEQRVVTSEFEGVRIRSQETVDLCLEKLCKEGITRDELVELAKVVSQS